MEFTTETGEWFYFSGDKKNGGLKLKNATVADLDRIYKTTRKQRVEHVPMQTGNINSPLQRIEYADVDHDKEALALWDVTTL